jgi:hypothetical protein
MSAQMATLMLKSWITGFIQENLAALSDESHQNSSRSLIDRL